MLFSIILTRESFLFGREGKMLSVLGNNDSFYVPETKNIIPYYVFDPNHSVVLLYIDSESCVGSF